RPHPLRAEIERWARVFGFESIEIYLGPVTPLVVMPLARFPASVLLPSDLQDGPKARFAVARAMVLVGLCLPLPVRLPPRDVTLLLNAILRQFEPMIMADGIDPAQLDDLARRVTRTLPRPLHNEMAQHA